MACKGCSGTCCTGQGSEPCSCPDPDAELTLTEASDAYQAAQDVIDIHLLRCSVCQPFGKYCTIAKMLVRVQDDYTELMVDAYNREMR